MRSQFDHPLKYPRLSTPLVGSLLTSILVVGGAVFALGAPQPAFAIGTTVGLGNAGSYSVLGGEAVTNTGSSVLRSNVGVSPGSAVTGFPPGGTDGTIHAADAHSLQAKVDLTTAYNNAAGQASDAAIPGELGGLTLTPGVYTASSSTQITGPLTLDGQGDPDAVFIFQIGSALTTASNSSIALLNDAQSCRVFWQVGSSAMLGTNSSFVGTIMALASVTANTGATVEGRALAREGSVTLDSNVFTDVKCASTSTTPPTSPAPTVTPADTATPTATGGGTTTPPATAPGTSTPDTSTPGPAATTPGTSTPGLTETAAPTATTRSSASAAASESSTRAVVAGNDSSYGDSAGSLASTGGGLPGPLIAIAAATSVIGLALILTSRKRRIS